MEKTTLTTGLTLLNDAEFEAYASKLNPNVSWAKFILTDDLPNGNKEMIEQDEFANLISTGIHMPMKMAGGEISEGHDGSFPLGAIAELTQDGNAIVGLAALWKKERPDEVELIRNKKKNKEPVYVSWELSYTDREENDEGIASLKNVSLNAATIVGRPAYGARTPITAVASKNKEDNVEELERLQKRVDDLETEKKTLQEKLDEALSSIKEKDGSIASLTEEKEGLVQFKQEVEAERDRIRREGEIKDRFTAAGLEMDDDFFASKMDNLLSMPEEALNFMITELSAVASKKKEDEAEAGLTVTKISGQSKKLDAKELGRLLRESK